MRLIFNLLSRVSKLTLSIVIVLLFSLTIAAQTISGVSLVVSSILSGAFGLATIPNELSAELKVKDAKVSDLEIKNKTLSKDLEISNSAKGKAHLEVESLKKSNAGLEVKLAANRGALSKAQIEAVALRKRANSVVLWKGKKMTLQAAADDMARTVKNRTKKLAVANAGSIFGKSIPYVGVTLILASATYDLKAACDTMKDMDEFQRQTNPTSVAGADTAKVCGMEIPTKDEVIQMVKNSPDVAWGMAVSAYDGLVELIPTWDQVKASPGVMWDGIVVAGKWTADGAVAAGGWTVNKANDGYAWTADGISDWWNGAPPPD